MLTWADRKEEITEITLCFVREPISFHHHLRSTQILLHVLLPRSHPRLPRTLRPPPPPRPLRPPPRPLRPPPRFVREPISFHHHLQLLWQLEASDLSVSTASYNLVISACEMARKPEVALQVYEHMVHQKCTPDTFTHLSLIRSCIWGSFWEEVEEILNHATPDASLYNAAIQGMSFQGKTELAKKLYTNMRKNGLQPDGKTRAVMLQNLRRHRKTHPSRYRTSISKPSPNRRY